MDLYPSALSSERCLTSQVAKLSKILFQLFLIIMLVRKISCFSAPNKNKHYLILMQQAIKYLLIHCLLWTWTWHKFHSNLSCEFELELDHKARADGARKCNKAMGFGWTLLGGTDHLHSNLVIKLTLGDEQKNVRYNRESSCSKSAFET